MNIFSFLTFLNKRKKLLWVILLLFIIFIKFGGLNFLINFNKINFFNYYYRYIIISVVLIPVFFNGVVLILLFILKKKENISVPEFLPNILKKIISYLIRISKNKELLNYYKGRGYAEMYFLLYNYINISYYLFLISFFILIKFIL